MYNSLVFEGQRRSRFLWAKILLREASGGGARIGSSSCPGSSCWPAFGSTLGGQTARHGRKRCTSSMEGAIPPKFTFPGYYSDRYSFFFIRLRSSCVAGFCSGWLQGPGRSQPPFCSFSWQYSPAWRLLAATSVYSCEPCWREWMFNGPASCVVSAKGFRSEECPVCGQRGVPSDRWNVSRWNVGRLGKKEKRDSSLRKPTASQERGGKKRRRLAPFGMTGEGGSEKVRPSRCGGLGMTKAEEGIASKDAGATKARSRFLATLGMTGRGGANCLPAPWLAGGWDRLLNWVAHPLRFQFSKGAAFDFVFSLFVTRAQRRGPFAM